MIEDLPGGPGDITLLYRATSEQDLLFRSELDTLASARRIDVRYLLGRRHKEPIRSAPATCASSSPMWRSATSICAGRRG